MEMEKSKRETTSWFLVLKNHEAKKHGRYQMKREHSLETFGLSVSGFFVLTVTAVMTNKWQNIYHGF